MGRDESQTEPSPSDQSLAASSPLLASVPAIEAYYEDHNAYSGLAERNALLQKG
jgi:hypothetical protein